MTILCLFAILAFGYVKAETYKLHFTNETYDVLTDSSSPGICPESCLVFLETNALFDDTLNNTYIHKEGRAETEGVYIRIGLTKLRYGLFNEGEAILANASISQYWYRPCPSDTCSDFSLVSGTELKRIQCGGAIAIERYPFLCACAFTPDSPVVTYAPTMPTVMATRRPTIQPTAIHPSSAPTRSPSTPTYVPTKSPIPYYRHGWQMTCTSKYSALGNGLSLTYRIAKETCEKNKPIKRNQRGDTLNATVYPFFYHEPGNPLSIFSENDESEKNFTVYNDARLPIETLGYILDPAHNIRETLYNRYFQLASDACASYGLSGYMGSPAYYCKNNIFSGRVPLMTWLSHPCSKCSYQNCDGISKQYYTTFFCLEEILTDGVEIIWSSA